MDSTMPGGQRQHSVRGIGGLIRFCAPKSCAPARWQLIGHRPPIGADEPGRDNVFPPGHPQATRGTTEVLKGSVASVPSTLSGRKPRGVHSPKT